MLIIVYQVDQWPKTEAGDITNRIAEVETRFVPKGYKLSHIRLLFH